MLLQKQESTKETRLHEQTPRDRYWDQYEESSRLSVKTIAQAAVRKRSSDSSKKSCKRATPSDADEGKHEKSSKSFKKAKAPKVQDFPLGGISESKSPVFDLHHWEEASAHLTTHGYGNIQLLSPSEVLDLLCKTGQASVVMGTDVQNDLHKEPTNAQMPSMFSKDMVKDQDAGIHHSLAGLYIFFLIFFMFSFSHFLFSLPISLTVPRKI